MMDTIPIVDLSKWHDGSKNQCGALAADVDRHLKTLGFLMVTNHGLSSETSSAARGVARSFFQLAPHRKQLYACESEAYRGWIGPGLESNNASYGVSQADAPVDLKEAYSIGPEFDGVNKFRRLAPRWYAENTWPDIEIPGYRKAMLDWMSAADLVTRTILDILAEVLQLGPTWVKTHCDHAMATITVNYYPRVLEEFGWRVGAHTDFGTLTLLDRDFDNGLQVECEPGRWIDVPAIPDALTINLGEMMALLSQGRWRANPHRVRAIPDAPENLSMIYFHSPNFDMPLPNASAAEGYTTAGEFLGQKMDQIVRTD